MESEDAMFLPWMSDALWSQWTLPASVLGEDKIPVVPSAGETGTATVLGRADAVRAFDRGGTGTDTELVLGEESLAVLKNGGFGNEDSLGVLELLSGGSAAVGAVTDGELDGRVGVLF